MYIVNTTSATESVWQVSVSSSGVYLCALGEAASLGRLSIGRLLLCLPSLPTQRVYGWYPLPSRCLKYHWQALPDGEAAPLSTGCPACCISFADSPKCFCCGHKRKAGLEHSVSILSLILAWSLRSILPAFCMLGFFYQDSLPFNFP